MANINTPAHDFAPPWLKFPVYGNSQNESSAENKGGHSSRKEGHPLGSTRPTKENGSFLRQAQGLNESRRDKNAIVGERKPSYLSSYHHSLDFDDSQSEGNGILNVNGGIGITSNSQSALLRRPHSRHDFRNIPSSFIKSESLGRHLNNSAASYYGNKTKGKVSESGNSGYNDNGGISNDFNQEFPSLQGGVSEEPDLSPTTVNGSVWEKPRNMKIHTSANGKKIQLIKKPVSSENVDTKKTSSGSSSLSPSNPSTASNNSHTVIVTPVAKGGIYRALIPAKATTAKKILTRDSVKSGPSKKPPSVTPPPVASTMEILVKYPKAPGNKSDFLKTLRNETKSTDTVEEEDETKNNLVKDESSDEAVAKDFHENGIDISNLSVNDTEDENALSSSLEAERRLLREMGWKEEVSDDDNYAPLTEDEMREFRALTAQIKKNGIKKKFHTNLSPKRPFTDVTLPTESDSTSSDSDFDF